MKENKNSNVIQIANIASDDLRAFFNQLLRKAYTNPEITANDARAFASLAVGLDTFLQNNEDRELAVHNLLDALRKIAEDCGYKKQNISTKMAQAKSEDILGQKKLVTDDGKYLYLGSILGSGGEGTVYKIPSMPGKVAKIYNDRIDIDEKKRHLKAFIHSQIPSKIDNTLIATVPEKGLYTSEGEFVGYLMPQISSQFKIYDVMRPTSERMKYFPELDYRGLIVIAYNLAEVVNCMHRHGVIIGDLSLSNIVVNTDGTVCLIDADSFDITDSITKERFPCCVGMAELLAPELQKAGQLKGLFTKATDYFSLAIIIFRLLMNNADPFATTSFDNQLSVSVNDVYSPIFNGECAFVKDIPGKKIPDWAPDFDALPIYIKDLFKRVFDYNSSDYLKKIVQRPTAEEWMQALMRYYQAPLKHCRKDTFHWYRSELSKCPFCEKRNVEKESSFISIGI